ncbi:MAG: hypothetical protein MUE47_04515, partial [Acidobacteria bacterium]|nr:hypothetical protein [Acidobacteriota bacterium]
MGERGTTRPARPAPPARPPRRLRAACLASALVALPGVAHAQRLPLTPFTSTDGLASDRILCVVPDSRGFLWFCHNGQLSRFDGERFVRYGAQQGLPGGAVRDLLERRDGVYLLATAAGVYRFDPRGGERLFVPLAAPGEQAPSVHALHEDRSHRVWAGAGTGLYEVLVAVGDPTTPRHRRVDLPGDANLPTSGVYDLVEDRDGALWLATEHGLVRRDPAGPASLITTRDGLPGNDVRTLVLDRTGALWAGTTMGIARLDPRAAARGAPLVSDVIRPSSDLPHRFVSALFESADGTLWAGALALGVLPPERQHPLRFRWFTTANGLTQNDVTCFAEDRDGNLWIGTEAGGATRLTRGGFVAYGEAEGLVHPRIASLFETTDGRLCASTEYTLACFDGERFASAPLPVPQEQAGWGWYQWIQQDRAGDWWLPTREGLRRYAGVRGPPDLAGARYATLCDDAPGPEPCNVFRVFEDAQADLWIGTISTTPRSQLVRWERATGRLQRFPLANGLTIQAPTAFREDGRGALWIGLFD